MIKLARGTKRKFTFDTSTVQSLALEAEEVALKQIEKEQAEALKHKLPDFWLPSLTPTYATSGPPTSLKDVKLQTTCRGGGEAHSLAWVFSKHYSSKFSSHISRRKNLIAVKFVFDRSPTAKPSSSTTSTPAEADSETSSSNNEKKQISEPPNPMCPSCKKTFSNNTLMFRTLLSQLVLFNRLMVITLCAVMKPCGHVVCKTCTDSLVKPSKQCIHCDVVLAGEKDIIPLTREGTGYAAGGLAETSKKGVAFQG